MLERQDRNKARQRRHRRIRKRVTGNGTCPRLSVFRSSRHIYAQIIDDEAGVTLTAASSLEREGRAGREATGAGGGKIQLARLVGGLIARRAQEQGISRVVFDRGGYHYHGRVQALAEGAREAGLQF